MVRNMDLYLLHSHFSTQISLIMGRPTLVVILNRMKLCRQTFMVFVFETYKNNWPNCY